MIDDTNEGGGSYRSFRTSLDLGMGVFYVIIAVLVIYVKYFGKMELSASYAYILGGMMLAYGIFRIYRGMRSMQRKSRD